MKKTKFFSLPEKDAPRGQYPNDLSSEHIIIVTRSVFMSIQSVQRISLLTSFTICGTP